MPCPQERLHAIIQKLSHGITEPFYKVDWIIIPITQKRKLRPGQAEHLAQDNTARGWQSQASCPSHPSGLCELWSRDLTLRGAVVTRRWQWGVGPVSRKPCFLSSSPPNTPDCVWRRALACPLTSGVSRSESSSLPEPPFPCL